jgi:hypothetical protein
MNGPRRRSDDRDLPDLASALTLAGNSICHR